MQHRLANATEFLKFNFKNKSKFKLARICEGTFFRLTSLAFKAAQLEEKI